MNIEKILFLILTLIGIFYNPLSIIAAGMVFIYILASEHSLNKKNKSDVLTHVNNELNKLQNSINVNEENIQRVKDSIIGLKLERGLSSKTMR